MAGEGECERTLTEVVLPFDLATSATFQHLRSAHRRNGRMDLKIASICIAHDTLLLTRNLADSPPLRAPG